MRIGLRVRNAVKELNAVMGLVPPITVDEDNPELVMWTLYECKALLLEGDIISTETHDVLLYVEKWAKTQEKGEAAMSKKKKVKKTEEMCEMTGITEEQMEEVMEEMEMDDEAEVEAEVEETFDEEEPEVSAECVTDLECDSCEEEEEEDDTPDPIDEQQVQDELAESERSLKEKKKGKERTKEEKGTRAKAATATTTNEVRDFVTYLIAENVYTVADIVETTMTKFPDKKEATIRTMISDGKNPKYNRFRSLVVIDKETKIVSFLEGC